MDKQPEEMPEDMQAMPAAKPEKAHGKKKLWCWIIWILVLLALAGVIAWLVWRLNVGRSDYNNLSQQNQKLTEQVKDLKDKLAAKEAAESSSSDSGAGGVTPCSNTPSVAMKENIKAALDSKNTAAFATYTTNPVTYVLAASEFGGDITPNEAAVSLEYTHSATGPWDFNLPPATIAAYDAGFYTDYFDANSYVGKAASGMVVSFGFDCKGKINKIFVAADASLL